MTQIHPFLERSLSGSDRSCTVEAVDRRMGRRNVEAAQKAGLRLGAEVIDGALIADVAEALCSGSSAEVGAVGSGRAGSTEVGGRELLRPEVRAAGAAYHGGAGAASDSATRRGRGPGGAQRPG